VPQSTVDDLTALGPNLDQTIATLGNKADGILPTTANYWASTDNATPTPPPRRAPPPRAVCRQRREHARSTRGTRPRPRQQRPAATSTASRAQEEGDHAHAACGATLRLAYS